MITEYEVDFMEEIGFGGLYVPYPRIHQSSLIVGLTSGKVHRGTWNKTEVALKVLRTDAGVCPSGDVRP
jgi:hypothetical protein